MIPAMDHLDSALATTALDGENKYLLSIQAAASISKKLLNKYYDMTDHSEVYRIAMGIVLPVYNLGLHSLEFFWFYILVLSLTTSRTRDRMTNG